MSTIIHSFFLHHQRFIVFSDNTFSLTFQFFFFYYPLINSCHDCNNNKIILFVIKKENVEKKKYNLLNINYICGNNFYEFYNETTANAHIKRMKYLSRFRKWREKNYCLNKKLAYIFTQFSIIPRSMQKKKINNDMFGVTVTLFRNTKENCNSFSM